MSANVQFCEQIFKVRTSEKLLISPESRAAFAGPSCCYCYLCLLLAHAVSYHTLQLLQLLSPPLLAAAAADNYAAVFLASALVTQKRQGIHPAWAHIHMIICRVVDAGQQ